MSSISPKISVILPIYNAEPYLTQCLGSISKQSLEDIEIICVNDGSTDASLLTIKRFAATDARFVVVDKINSGYGASVNKGLEVAKGEYVSIIEPDDFIDQRMDEVLYSFACNEFEGNADIVKGAYWEYYDKTDERPSLTKLPSLALCMPQYTCRFDISSVPEIICHHPSIWSALYRREFLDECAIRFREIPGAGWADNPFLFETMLQAKSICWVPKPLYYYRQSNTTASSFLKDFRLPFERLEDIREIMESISCDDAVKAAFYKREFDYINDELNIFDFTEDDKEVRALILQTLETMDRDIVENHPRIWSRYLDFYHCALRVGDFPGHAASSNPVVSFLLPVKLEDRYGIIATISSLQKLEGVEFECVCTAVGAVGFAYEYVAQVAKTDKRFVLGGTEKRISDALNIGVQLARGKYVSYLVCGYELRNDFYPKALEYAIGTHADTLVSVNVGIRANRLRSVLDERRRRRAELPEISEEGQIASLYSLEAFASIPEKDACGYLEAVNLDAAEQVFKKSFLNENKLLFSSSDERSALSLCARALSIPSNRTGCFEPFGKKIEEPRHAVKAYPNQFNQYAVEAPSFARSLLACENDNWRSSEDWDAAWKSLICTAFVCDISNFEDDETLACYIHEVFPNIVRLLGIDQPDACCTILADSDSYVQCVDIAQRGIALYALKRLYNAENIILDERSYANDLETSTAFRFGHMMVKTAKKVLPRRMGGE